MAASNTHTTVSNLEKGYRKTATKLYSAFKSRVEEFSWIEDVQDEEITPSGRENLIPLDVNRGYGSAAITDGGYEARTVTPAMAEGSFSLVQFNRRFFISKLAQQFDERGNPLGKPVKVLGSFLAGDGETRGRPRHARRGHRGRRCGAGGWRARWRPSRPARPLS